MRIVVCIFFITSVFSCKQKPISEKSFIDINGEKQYVEITGPSADAAVLLFIHGGPGWPQTPHLRYFNADLTKEVILVAWEQSGCGQSFVNNPNPKNLSLEQIIKDGHELTQYLKKKYNKNKIYLAGFSWGSIIGLRLAEQYPDDYAAYFGISQITNVRRGIQVSREWIKKEAAFHGDTAAVRTLEKIEQRDTSVCKQELDCFFKQYELLSKYRGHIYKKESEVEIEKAVTAYPDYKNYDWMGGFDYSIKRLQNDLFTADLTGIKEIRIPVYFFTGKFDWNIPPALITEYVNALKAPSREIVWFEQSGHEPLEEEAKKFNTEMLKRIH